MTEEEIENLIGIGIGIEFSDLFQNEDILNYLREKRRNFLTPSLVYDLSEDNIKYIKENEYARQLTKSDKVLKVRGIWYCYKDNVRTDQTDFIETNLKISYILK
jgi:hypothetical protein